MPIAIQPGVNPWLVHHGSADSFHTLFLSADETDYLAHYLSKSGLRLTVLAVGVAEKPVSKPLPCGDCFSCPWIGDTGLCGVPSGDLSEYGVDSILSEAAHRCPLSEQERRAHAESNQIVGVCGREPALTP
jgi:hypothetical protein